MLIEIHMIQNHSPANMNRDDLGAPKTCLFGGVPRARISSQCLKRSIRSPQNPEDVHNRGAGMFAQAMAAHIGCRTKFFPDLVKQELVKSQIPVDDHERIILKAERIAVSKEKEEKRGERGAKSDPRRRTPQLIHLGPGHAKLFVEQLQQLRESHQQEYRYFLDPQVGFEEMVADLLSEVEETEREKIVRASWVIAKFRMKVLLRAAEGEEAEAELETKGREPSAQDAKIIAERLPALAIEDKTLFKKLTARKLTDDEKRQMAQMKRLAPEKAPPGMKDFMKALQSANRFDAVDIALFGRMTTSDAFQDVEAAMQVAHAISTNKVANETDYFTAVDDLGKTGGGAGHVDEAMYNSACFYKYFSLDWDQLVRNLAGPEPDGKKYPEAHKIWTDKLQPNAPKLAAAALGHFIRAAALTTPSGKQNSFASHCDPCGILIEIKKTKTPTSHANAFAEPVERIGKPDDDTADEKSIEGRSVACLADHIHAIRQAYGIDSTLLWYSPKLWRFPFQYWERSEDGKKKEDENNKPLPAKLVTPSRFSVLDQLVEAALKQLGFQWSEVKNAGAKEA